MAPHLKISPRSSNSLSRSSERRWYSSMQRRNIRQSVQAQLETRNRPGCAFTFLGNLSVLFGIVGGGGVQKPKVAPRSEKEFAPVAPAGEEKQRQQGDMKKRGAAPSKGRGMVVRWGESWLGGRMQEFCAYPGLFFGSCFPLRYVRFVIFGERLIYSCRNTA